MIEWIDTPESTNIVRFGYDEDVLVLTVEFKNGTTYNYFDVHRHIFERMKISPSKGQFLAQNIKGNYRYARA